MGGVVVEISLKTKGRDFPPLLPHRDKADVALTLLVCELAAQHGAQLFY